MIVVARQRGDLVTFLQESWFVDLLAIALFSLCWGRRADDAVGVVTIFAKMICLFSPLLCCSVCRVQRLAIYPSLVLLTVCMRRP